MIKQPIGVFDSGVGGLSVLSTLTHAFPNESFIYVGDTLRAPWGSRSVDELHDIVFEIIAFLLKKDIKMLVIACNTSNSLFLEDVINQIKIPVQDLVLPTALSLSPQALSAPIAVMATQNTVNTHSYQQAIHSISPNTTVHEIACPELVPLIETNRLGSSEASLVAAQYTSKLIDLGCQTIIHGCTHYPFFESLLSKENPKFKFINPANCIVSPLNQKLVTHSLKATVGPPNKWEGYVTKDVETFHSFINNFNLWELSDYQLNYLNLTNI